MTCLDKVNDLMFALRIVIDWGFRFLSFELYLRLSVTITVFETVCLDFDLLCTIAEYHNASSIR
jgi:hypothetical protein